MLTLILILRINIELVMKLNHLDREYFRCFKKYQIDFASDITVFIGKNAKSSSVFGHFCFHKHDFWL